MFKFDNLFSKVSKDQALEFLNKLVLSRGIEREFLRTDKSAQLINKDFPKSLGSALMNKYITNDFSSSMIELITPNFDSLEDCFHFLEQLHLWTIKNLDNDEYIWANSMPCILDDDIKIAEFGSSMIGRLKHLYRTGLVVRYGINKQMLSGLHYNVSFSEDYIKNWCNLSNVFLDINNSYNNIFYFSLIRNYYRFSWFIFYIFSKTSICDKSYVKDQLYFLNSNFNDNFYIHKALCLRMSNFGYVNNSNCQFRYTDNYFANNSKEEYIYFLSKAISKKCSTFFCCKSNKYPQISSNYLQLDNEFYSDIRAKNKSDSSLNSSLYNIDNAYVKWIELRFLDVDMDSFVGIKIEDAKFLELVLVYLSILSSPKFDYNSFSTVFFNRSQAIILGLDEKLKIYFNNNRDKTILINDYAKIILEDLAILADLMDDANKNNKSKDNKLLYKDVVEQKMNLIYNFKQHPAYDLKKSCENKNFVDVISQKSKDLKELSKKININNELFAIFDKEKNDSQLAQEELEYNDKNKNFEEFKTKYLKQFEKLYNKYKYLDQ